MSDSDVLTEPSTVTTDEGPAAPAPDGPGAERRAEIVARLAVALTIAPLVLSALHLLVFVGGDYHPSGDLASTELLTRDVGRRMLWLGPYSRDGWYHPGPSVFYLLALPYRVFGSSAVAMSVGALVVNGASVVGMALLARRRAGLPLMLSTLVVSSVLLHALGPEFVRIPWNPYLTVLPYGLSVFLTWSMACGDRWALPVATFVTSFLVQTHVGYLGLAGPLLLGGAAWLAVATIRSGRGTKELIGPGLAAGAVGAVMWLPPVVQQLTDEPGNLGEMAQYFRHGGEVRTLGDGWKVVASQFAWPPDWIFGQSATTWLAEPSYLTETVLPILLVPVLLAGLVLWRSSESAARSLTVVWLLACGLGIVATARTIGLIYAYRLGWVWVLGMIGGLLMLWAVWSVLQRYRPRQARLLVPGALAVLAIVAVFNGASAVRAGTPEERVSTRIGELSSEVRHGLPEDDGEVLITPTSFGVLAYHLGLILDLERHGVEASEPATLGGSKQNRAYTGGPLRAELYVAVDQDIVDHLDRPGYELLAYTGTVPLEQLVEDAEEVRALEAEYQSGELSLEEYGRRRQRLLPTDAAVAVLIDQS